MYRHTTATATSVVTTGAKYTVRNRPRSFATLEFTSSAAPSETPRDSGTPSATKYKVLPSDFQNSGSCSRRT